MRASVAGTPLDFNAPTVVGDRIDADFEALTLGGGYDHCWVVRGENGTIRPAARVSDPVSGRFMEVSSDQPAIQFYAGNFLDGTAEGRNHIRYGRRSGLCLETENFPDAPNQPTFPVSSAIPIAKRRWFSDHGCINGIRTAGCAHSGRTPFARVGIGGSGAIVILSIRYVMVAQIRVPVSGSSAKVKYHSGR